MSSVNNLPHSGITMALMSSLYNPPDEDTAAVAGLAGGFAAHKGKSATSRAVGAPRKNTLRWHAVAGVPLSQNPNFHGFQWLAGLPLITPLGVGGGIQLPACLS